MTSVAVVSSAVARITRLKDVASPPEKLKVEIDQFLKSLEEIKYILVAAHDPRAKAVELKFDEEKQVVRLSYNIVDAVANAAPLKLVPEEVGVVQEKLRNLLCRLQGKNPDEGSAVPRTEVVKKKSVMSTLFARKSSLKLGKDVQIKEPVGSPRLASPPGLEVKSSEVPDRDPVQQVDLLNMLRAELLKKESSSDQVVYLAGKSGMGKTTLARKLFNDLQLRDRFENMAWVPITRNFHMKGVFKLLLQQLGPQPDIREMNEIDLISHIFARLKGKPYLLVLEDVESRDDWESIRLALPTAQSFRVIVTTSSMDIVQGSKEHCHRISGFTQTDIIALLKEKGAFRSDKVGEAIYDISGGSPLFATILGKSFVSAEEDEEQLVDELQSYKNRRGTARVLEASYNRLDYEQKPVLLYLGQFPTGQDVDIDKMYLMLAAENLITPEKDSNISPQCLVEYLKELDRLKLVQMQEDHVVPARGLYRSCRLHDQVWDFCKFKALDEEFLDILDLGSSTREEVGPYTRRLAVYLRLGDIKTVSQSIKPATLKVLLTLVIIDTFEKKSTWPGELNDLSDSSRLRILSFDGVNFKVRPFPRGLERLFHIRYLSFRGCFLEELPSSVSSLTHLETLDLLVRDDCNMRIPHNVFAKMERMLHLYFPRMYRSSADGKAKLHLQGMEKLEILVNFDTEICDVKALNQLKNLKILSIISEGNLDNVIFSFLTQETGKKLQYSSVNITSFDCYSSNSLSELKKLFGCGSIHSVHVEGRIGELPEDEAHAETIGEIVLEGSQLELDPMNYLGKFKNLHSLVLSNDAFLGIEITISAALFPNLRSLRLQSLQFLKKLTIKNNAMPMLSSLQIHGCDSLSELHIPRELDGRLKKSHVNNGGDDYSVMPYPAHFNIY